jgi:hypothetical protein
VTDRSALVPVSPYGPLVGLALTVHEMAASGNFGDAMAAADEFQAVARAFGDEKTVDFLIQGRMFAHQYHATSPGRWRRDWSCWSGTGHPGTSSVRRRRWPIWPTSGC